jgi:hypothetical protein
MTGADASTAAKSWIKVLLFISHAGCGFNLSIKCVLWNILSLRPRFTVAAFLLRLWSATTHSGPWTRRFPYQIQDELMLSVSPCGLACTLSSLNYAPRNMRHRWSRVCQLCTLRRFNLARTVDRHALGVFPLSRRKPLPRKLCKPLKLPILLRAPIPIVCREAIPRKLIPFHPRHWEALEELVGIRSDNSISPLRPQ